MGSTHERATAWSPLLLFTHHCSAVESPSVNVGEGFDGLGGEHKFLRGEVTTHILSQANLKQQMNCSGPVPDGPGRA